jgi:phosphoglycerate kinase
MKSITEAGDIRGKRVLVRVDWNVPIKDGKLLDDFRIQKSLKTLNYLRENGARIIVISHLAPATESLQLVAEHVSQFYSLSFCADMYGEETVRCINNLPNGGTLVLENLRMHPGEKENSEAFARTIASLGDIYVNEAFSASHRKHASICSIPKFLLGYAGIQFMEEISHLEPALHPSHPFLLILGGAKFETKLSLLQKYVEEADNIFVGGALAHNFFKEEGIDIKKSLVSEGDFPIKGLLASGKIMLPNHPVWKDDRIVDAGKEDVDAIRAKIDEASMVLWNGPLGNYEMGYKEATLELAEAIAKYAKNSIVGGGDTLAAIKELDNYSEYGFVSTAGGAMLDYLANGTLPGIEALR